MKYRVIKYPHDSRKYREEAIELAFSAAPHIYPCAECGHPVLDGYCCGTCGSTDPRKVTGKVILGGGE